MTETTERFLQEIATRVGHDRVAELYLFPVLRQGGVEGAVAVVVAHPEPERDARPGDAQLADVSAAHPRARHVVHTARYQHTVKGTERGRWVVEVVAEADAPLVTVEEVIRGVVRRSGDAFQPERISGDQLRALVAAPAVPGSAPA